MEITSKNFTIPISIHLTLEDGALDITVFTGDSGEGTHTLITWRALLHDLMRFWQRPDGSYDDGLLEELDMLEAAVKDARGAIPRASRKPIKKKR